MANLSNQWPQALEVAMRNCDAADEAATQYLGRSDLLRSLDACIVLDQLLAGQGLPTR
ncbi:hypothetical protein [Amycolatopsis methanolica]|uniref:Uncharacterized protein n=1 Tax=Amycolatopsis methanolica 239 TaxID=1068978 RepID=A0A076N3L5_AMYME|nr:hypothetical protein [Amycolatopsis methanolica]AIJ25811.1 hypothetical protein AMETH_5719 [Amycolatopsis methanolica 239]